MIMFFLLIVVLIAMGAGGRPASQPAITRQRTRPLRPTKRQLKRAYRAQRADLRRALKR